MAEEFGTARDRFMRENPFMNHNNIRLGDNGDEWSEVYLDVTTESTNPYGFVHGGALFTMADCCAGMTARLDGRRYVTQDSSVQFIHNVDHGRLTAHGKVLNRGKRICLVQVRIRNEEGELLFNGAFSMFCIDVPAPEEH